MVSLCGISQVYYVYWSLKFAKSGDVVADGCKIIVGLVQMYNGDVKILKL